MIRPSSTVRQETRTLPKSRTDGSDRKASEAKVLRHRESDKENCFFPAETLRPMGAKNLCQLKIPSPARLWGALISSGQLGMVFGWRGTGKSTFMMALALAMASEAKFLGITAKKAAKVVLLDGEMDLYSMQRRLELISASLDVELTNNLRIMSPELFSGVMPKLTTPEGQREIDKAIGDSWDVLIIDNYSSFSSGREDADAWAPWLPWLLKHKRAGHTVIIVHHTGKNGTQRGASNHEDPMDFVISLRPPKIPSGNGALEFVVSWTKSRHLPPDRTKPFQVAFRKTEHGNHIWTRQDEIDANPLLAEVKQMHACGKTLAEIAAKVKRDKSTISRWLKT